MAMKFKITNIDCPACVKLSSMALGKITGVQNSDIDLKSGLVELTADRDIAWEEITAALKTVNKQAVTLD